MDDLSYSLPILHRYMLDLFQYVSGDYPKIKFIFFKNKYPKPFRYIYDTSNRRWKTDMCGLPDASAIFDIYVID